MPERGKAAVQKSNRPVRGPRVRRSRTGVGMPVFGNARQKLYWKETCAFQASSVL